MSPRQPKDGGRAAKRSGSAASSRARKSTRASNGKVVGKAGGKAPAKPRKKQAGKSASRPGSATSAPARPRIADALEAPATSSLADLYAFWSGPTSNGTPTEREVRKRISNWMSDPETVEARTLALGRRLGQVLARFLEAPSYRATREDLAAHKALSYLSEYDLEAALSVLQRHALVVACADPRFNHFGGEAFALPVEIGDGLLRLQRARRRGVFDVLTLRGHLDRLNDDPARTRRIAPTRLREMYKMYANESAAVARLERLPEELRGLVEKAVLQFGGLLPRGLFDRMDSDVAGWEGIRWRGVLEESLVGTVERLELGRYGIHLNDDTLIVFNEVALAWLRRVAVPSDPDQPDSEASLGVDLMSNISRFIGFILEHNVRFTVRGEIFKTTEKRIQQELIPNPGRELERSEVLSFIYAFCRAAGLIESTGERTFAMTSEGRHWEQRTLEHKLSTLVDYAIEEKNLAGDFYHQLRLRRIFMRLLKRVEPGTWYDLMYLPFLARNTYLASLDQLAVDEYFASRGQAANYTPMEDPQRLAWNLARWVRQRLYLLGVVDLGYDSSSRPVALRLTRSGARLLGLSSELVPDAPLIGSLVVTPDFEVVLFPTGDDAELVHELDRFCVREKGNETMHFRVLEKSVLRALGEGMHLARILTVLREQSRTPVPQNVLYSIRDWAHRAGLVILDSNMILHGENPEVLARFKQDPAARAYVRETIDEKRIQLKARYAPRRTQALLRDLGYLVELEM